MNSMMFMREDGQMGTCRICGKNFGLMGGGSEPYTGHNLQVCNSCGEVLKKIDKVKNEDTQEVKDLFVSVMSMTDDADVKQILMDYSNVNVAQKKLLSMPGQLKGYYIFDTEGDEKGENKKRYQGKRRVYTKEERKFIYRKYEGKCALCGKKITYKELTLDHIKPIFVGGADELENIQASCYACNQFKSSIRPEDFEQKIIDIFLYQMKQKCANDWVWKIIEKIILKRLDK